MHNKQILCLNCHAEIQLLTTVQKGEVITCPDCSLDLEITNIKPIEVAKAPEVEEDWGE